MEFITIALVILGLFALALLYLLPSIIAVVKEHPHRAGIIIVNVLGGFVFGIGWLIALIWVLLPVGSRRSGSPGADR